VFISATEQVHHIAEIGVLRGEVDAAFVAAVAVAMTAIAIRVVTRTAVS
jgi:hypothetical protein